MSKVDPGIQKHPGHPKLMQLPDEHVDPGSRLDVIQGSIQGYGERTKFACSPVSNEFYSQPAEKRKSSEQKAPKNDGHTSDRIENPASLSCC